VFVRYSRLRAQAHPHCRNRPLLVRAKHPTYTLLSLARLFNGAFLLRFCATSEWPFTMYRSPTCPAECATLFPCSYISPFPVHNTVHNLRSVTQTSPRFNRLYWSAAFLTTQRDGRKPVTHQTSRLPFTALKPPFTAGSTRGERVSSRLMAVCGAAGGHLR